MLKMVGSVIFFSVLLGTTSYGSQRIKATQQKSRMRELASAVAVVDGAGPCKEWSLSNPEGKSLIEVLVDQRICTCASMAKRSSLLLSGFEDEIVDIRKPIRLNTVQVQVFKLAMDSREMREERLLACTIMNLVIEETTLQELKLSVPDLRKIFINLERFDIVKIGSIDGESSTDADGSE